MNGLKVNAPYCLSYENILAGDIGIAGILPVSLSLFPIGTYSAGYHSVAQSCMANEGNG